jgi:SulP family sulfate permease
MRIGSAAGHNRLTHQTGRERRWFLVVNGHSTSESQRAGFRRKVTVERVARFVPILGWLPQYRWSEWPLDAIAGATVWGLLIPEMIAYAGLAGLPPQAGLYTLVASLGLYALFGTSRQLVVAGTSASAVLVYSAVTALHPTDAHQYMVIASGFIVITGAMFVAAGLLKLGFITAFLSRPVMDGFVFGLAIFVTVSQLPKLFGIKKGEGDSIRQLAHVVDNLGHASLTTFVVGAVALVVLFALERYVPRVPGGLVVLVAGIAISAAANLSDHGVDTVGQIPSGLPSIVSEHITVSQLWVLLPSAVGMMLVIFSEALGAGQTFADRHGYRLDSSQEMIALGLANIGSGFLGGLACGGSLSQSAVNDGAGARSELSSVVAAVLSLITVIALTPLFKDLPEAVLAALIIHAVSHLMKVAEMRRYYRLIPREFWLGIVTLTGVIVLDVLPGLIIGVVLSILLVVYRDSRIPLSVLGADPAVPGAFVDLERHPTAVAIPGVLVVRPDGTVYYVNAQSIQDTIESLLSSASEQVRAVIVDLDANDELDITSCEKLARLVHDLRQNNIQVGFAHFHAPALDLARRAGVLDELEAAPVFETLAQAMTWATTPGGESAEPPPDDHHR